ncbi:MAG: redoxin family protein [Acidobacteria bacterium]|nr:redoxin family protein [Acidobacteriota bacterium]
MTRKTKNQRSKRLPTTTNSAKGGVPWWSWLAVVLPVAALAAVVLAGVEDPAGSAVGTAAPEFDLLATDGSRYDLNSVLEDGDALLYFSMGPGCDGCFLQIPEVEDALANRGIKLVPIMVDPAVVVAGEAQRFGISTPILIDSDRQVSNAYGMIGVYGHRDRPSHSFALVDQKRQIAWGAHYAEMFVPTEQLLADLESRT